MHENKYGGHHSFLALALLPNLKSVSRETREPGKMTIARCLCDVPRETW